MSIPKPPIHQDMFISPGVMSAPWIKFFTSLETNLSSSVEDITEIEEEISGGSEDISVAVAALSAQLNTLHSTTTISTAAASAEDNYLTLYWMGV